MSLSIKLPPFLTDPKSAAGLIFLAALAARIGFYFWGAPVYYGSSGFQLSGDFGAWARSIENLVVHGQYTIALGSAEGPFFRPPGYGFFILPFYLIFGNWEDAYVWIAATQILLDAAAAVFLFRAVLMLTGNMISAWLGGLLYAFYFFALGWTPVLYPEAPSLFFLIAGFYFFVQASKMSDSHKTRLWYWFAFGASWGIAALLRIQLLVILTVPPLVFIWEYIQNRRVMMRPFIFALAGVLLTYGLWPARNMINYGEPVFIQKLTQGGVWSEDCTSFFGLLKAVQVDHQPQFSQLLDHEDIRWPEEISWTAEDSAKIDRAVALMHDCGRATQRWKINEGHGDGKILAEHCDREVATIWEDLTRTAKKRHPFYTSVTVPLMNLSKCFFKSSLEKQKTPAAVRIAFGIRSALILAGLFSCLWLFFHQRKKYSATVVLITASFSAVYLSLSFVARHIEMRYLLQADVLLLIPLAIIAGEWVIHFKKKT